MEPTSLAPRRQRAELALLFALPKRQKQGLCELQCHLRVNGSTCPPYGSGVFVLTAMWNNDYQQLQGHDAEARLVNRTLSEIRAQHRSLLHDLLRAERAPTASLVQHHWQTGQIISPPLLKLFEEYLLHLTRIPLSERKTPSTLQKWFLAQRRLHEYLSLLNRTELTLDEVSVGWARTYHQWLLERPMSSDFSARLVLCIREVLQYALEHELILHNKLQQMTILRQATKAVVCLSPEQVDRLATLDGLPPTLDMVRKWALFMCYTGLDYVDAISFTRKPAQYIHPLPYGEKIVWRRLKFEQNKRATSDWGVCHIPLLPEAKRLLLQVPEWTVFTSQRINRNLGTLERMLELPFRLSTKVCRKTAGALFLLRGYPSEAVRKIMGLKTMAVFERNYLVLLGELVDANMERLSRQQAAGMPPLVG